MKKIIKVSLLVVWLGVIFYMSSTNGDGSSSLSSGLLRDICLLLRINDIDGFVLKYHSLFRKIAHFGEYFVLAFLLYINLIDHFTSKKSIIYSLMICVLYAASDEIHQLFVDDRSGNFIDVLIDSSGATASLFLIHLINSICYHERKH